MLPDAGAVTLPAGLGGDHQACGIRLERFGDQLLGDNRAVGVGGIDKVHAQLHGAAQRGQRAVAVRPEGPRCPCR